MITVDAESYTKDGKKYRRVTSLLKEYGLVPNYPEGNYADFGTHVHQACEYYDKGTLDMDTLDPALKPYLEQYRLFKTSLLMTDETIFMIEQTLFSDKYGFAGTIDRVIRTSIYDIKTGAPADWHGVQLAMYKILAKENNIKVYHCYAVYLTDHDYKVQAYNKQIYHTVAMSILNIKNYKERR
jgi:hypothetical protein